MPNRNSSESDALSRFFIFLFTPVDWFGRQFALWGVRVQETLVRNVARFSTVLAVAVRILLVVITAFSLGCFRPFYHGLFVAFALCLVAVVVPTGNLRFFDLLGCILAACFMDEI